MQQAPENELRQLIQVESGRYGPFRIEVWIFVFFAAVAVLELFSSYGRYSQTLTETQGQALHVCVYGAIALSAVMLVRRLNYLPKVRWILMAALSFIVVGEILDLLRSLPQFKGIAFVSEASPYGDLLNRSLQTFGLSLYMASFYICMFELNGAEARLRQVLQNMPVMLDAIDNRGQFVVWNRECERVTGYAASEIVGNPKAMQLLYSEGQGPGRFPSGQPEATDYRDWECIVACKDGRAKTISWSSQSASVSIAGWTTWGVGIDVSLSRSLEEELMRIERTDAVGQLVGGIASRFELLLGPLKARFDQLKGSPATDLAPIANEALVSLARFSDTVRQLATLGRKSRATRRPIDLRPMIEHAIEHLSVINPDAAKVDIQLELGEGAIWGAIVPEEFDRAFAALLQNAVEASMPAEGKQPVIRVTARSIVDVHRARQPVSLTQSSQRPKPMTVIAIRDFGPGIPSNMLERVLQPFSSTRSPVEHAGLGLAVADSLLRRARGRIELVNEPAGGLSAQMWIPSDSPRMATPL